MKYVYSLILGFIILSNVGCSTFEKISDTNDRGDKYPLKITSYTKINEEQIYGKKIFILGDPNIENKILSSNTKDKLEKLLKIKARHLNYNERFRKLKIDVSADQNLADYLLLYNFAISQTGMTRASTTKGSQKGASFTKGAGVARGSSHYRGSQYKHHYEGHTDQNYQLFANMYSIFSKTYQSQTIERTKNVYGQELYISLIDAKKYKESKDIYPLWIGKINVTTYKKEMKGMVDILVIAGITYLGKDVDLSLDYYSKDARLNQIIAYLYTREPKR